MHSSRGTELERYGAEILPRVLSYCGLLVAGGVAGLPASGVSFSTSCPSKVIRTELPKRLYFEYFTTSRMCTSWLP